MSKLSPEEIQKIKGNLTIGKCPNCGYEGNKDLFPHEFNLLTLDTDKLNTFNPLNTGSLPVIVTNCPKCGYLSLFNRKFIDR